MKNHTYEVGDKLVITKEKNDHYFVVQLDETLAPTLLYIPEKKWEYVIPLEETKSSVETGFRSKRHHIYVRKAYDFEVESYRNVSTNPHDQKLISGAYPHAYANVETTNDVTFFAKNAIDGKFGNRSHGSYPFTSWGINQQKDATLTIDFGRSIQTDRVNLLFRGDYPHDSYWTEVSICFSDGETIKVATTDTLEFQSFYFPEKMTSSVTLKNLKKAEDTSPFPALTQIEIFGREVITCT
ncbi:hypothetical protein [Enterococcus sp. 3G1_DIV0629]|uniref:hypothetical protein n=1 Tax=Enterococcus sp. (strain 3G1_DIV0629) TaxID=1834176 RepID=UPI002119DE84|nr:hypothetical protein [Enterococcus sp. 3G1_DIV0629]